MILYGQRLSPYVRKVLVYAAEKGIDLAFEPGGFGAGGEAFARASPFGKIPAFVHEDFSISDSSAIIAYLEAMHPAPALIPVAPRARAQTIWFEEFADTILFGTGVKLFWNRFVAPRLKLPFDTELADQAEREELPGLLDYLEGVAPVEGFLVGDTITLADIAVASPMVNIAYVCPPVDGARHPRLRGWLDRMLARPSFAEAIALEMPKKGT